jgi:hypothetical protein
MMMLEEIIDFFESKNGLLLGMSALKVALILSPSYSEHVITRHLLECRLARYHLSFSSLS